MNAVTIILLVLDIILTMALTYFFFRARAFEDILDAATITINIDGEAVPIKAPGDETGIDVQYGVYDLDLARDAGEEDKDE